MTHPTPGASEAMTEARLNEIRTFIEPDDEIGGFWIDCSERQAATAIADALEHIDAQAAEIAALKAELATARNEVLEEAALAAETVTHAPGYTPPEPPCERYSLGFGMGKHTAAEAIRPTP